MNIKTFHGYQLFIPLNTKAELAGLLFYFVDTTLCHLHPCVI